MTDPAGSPPLPRKKTRLDRRPRRQVRRVALAVVLGLAGYLAWELATLPSGSEIARLRSGPLHETALMRERAAETSGTKGRLKPRLAWVEMTAISPSVVTAVVASEDARFFSHTGLDLTEVRNAVKDRVDSGRRLRGASTITQQVAKNLFLSGDRSFVRKAKEAWLAWRLERELPKARILALYLNVAEWGDGIFGIEAASRAHFGKPAADLDLAEAAALAGMLPNPRVYSPVRRPAAVHRRALHVLDRIEEDHAADEASLDAARARLARMFGQPEAEADASDRER